MKRPLAGLTLVFALGIFSGSSIKLPFALVYSLSFIFLVFCILAIKKESGFNIFIFLLIFFLGLAALKNSQSLPKCHISRYVHYKNSQPYLVRGFVDSAPLTRNGKATFIFKTKAVQFGKSGYNCCGSIFVYLKTKQNLHYGEELILKGRLYRSHYQKARFILRVANAAGCVKLNKNRGWPVKRIALWLKQRMEEIISQHTSSLSASILYAMVLGEKRDIPVVLYNAMVKSGTVHILVVSGFNVGIVTYIIVLFLKIIRLPKRLRLYLAIPLLILYCLITGASIPVIRATVMAIVFIAGILIRRQADIYNSLSTAAIFILAVNPQQLFDIGFQLSFASVISIAFFYPRIRSFLHPGVLKIKYLRLLIDGCIVSFSAWLGTLGLVAYYFRIFSPVTVVANLFIVPLAALITLCGFNLILMHLICPPIVKFFAPTIELGVTILFSINAFLTSFSGAYFCLRD